jgi:hypothetical protein
MKFPRLSPLLAASVLLSSWCNHSAAVTADNRNVWFNYVGDHPLFGTRWGVHLELQNRLSDWGREWQQLVVRPGINYQLSENVSLGLGYGFIRTYPYGGLPVAHRFDEHRIAEQIQVRHAAIGLKWTHRVRLEQRWIEELQKQPDERFQRENWRGEQRVRYMLRTELPLTEDRRWYVPLWNEVFLNFGGNIVGNHFDQNRAFIGLGWQMAKHVRLETGFLEQTVKRRGGQNWENNHTLSLWLSSNLPFFDGFR